MKRHAVHIGLAVGFLIFVFIGLRLTSTQLANPTKITPFERTKPESLAKEEAYPSQKSGASTSNSGNAKVETSPDFPVLIACEKKVEDYYLVCDWTDKDPKIARIEGGRLVGPKHLDKKLLRSADSFMFMSGRVQPTHFNDSKILDKPELSVKVWGKVVGLVVDYSGIPVRNATITFVPDKSASGQFQYFLRKLEATAVASNLKLDKGLLERLRVGTRPIQAKTLKKGAFLFSNLYVPATYSMQVDAAGCATSIEKFRLTKGARQIFKKVSLGEGLIVTGTVAPKKAQFRSASLSVWQRVGAGKQKPLIPRHKAQVPADGSFSINSLGAGDYVLAIAGETDEGWPFYCTSDLTLVDLGLDLGPIDVTEHEFVAEVVDSEGRPIENYPIGISHDEHFFLFDEYKLRTRKQGRFRCYLDATKTLNITPEVKGFDTRSTPRAIYAKKAGNYKFVISKKSVAELTLKFPKDGNAGFIALDAKTRKPVRIDRVSKHTDTFKVYNCVFDREAFSGDLVNIYELKANVLGFRYCAQIDLRAKKNTIYTIDSVDPGIVTTLDLTVEGVERLFSYTIPTLEGYKLPRLSCTLYALDEHVHLFMIDKKAKRVVIPRGLMALFQVSQKPMLVNGKNKWMTIPLPGTLHLKLTKKK